MRNHLWDSFESLLAELLLVENLPVRKAIPHACREFSGYPVGYLILSIVSAANVLGTGKLSKNHRDQALARELYQAAAMIASDVAMFEIIERPLPDCRTLMDHWIETGDSYFEV